MPEVWPFRPLQGCIETLEFFSEVLESYTGEQRIALRSAPRQNFDYSHRFATNRELAIARAIARQNVNQEIYVPVWPEETRNLGVIGSGDDSIAFDTSYADYRVGGFAMIFNGFENYVVSEISAIDSGLLTFTDVIGTDFSNASIIPIRRAFSVNGYNVNRQATYSDVSVQYMMRDNIDLFDSYVSPYPQFNSKDVITDRPVLFEAVSENLVRAAEYIDNGFGLVTLEPVKNYTDFGQTVSFYETRGENLWNRRLWIHSLRGKQKSFYLPTFNNDLELQSNISGVATTISVKSIAPVNYYLNKSIMIWTNSGNRYFRDITNAVEDGENVTLTISSSLGVAVSVSNVKMISFVTLNRLNSDQIQIRHSFHTGAIISIQTMEVPE